MNYKKILCLIIFGSLFISCGEKKARIDWVLYAKKSAGQNIELYTSPVTKGSPTLISSIDIPDLPFYYQLSFLLYKDTVVYIDPEGTLYTSPVNKSSPNLIDRDIDNFKISSNGEKIVYAKGNNLYSSSLTKSGITLLATDVDWFLITPDSKNIVYVVANLNLDEYELYSRSIDGSSSPVFYADLGDGGFEISKDSKMVVYNVYDYYTKSELYSSLIGQSSPKLIYTDPGWEPLPGSHVYYSIPFEITPDSKRVVYGGSSGLMSSPISGGPSIVISTDAVSSFWITPDSKRVIWLESRDLKSSSITTPSLVLIDTDVSSFQITPNSKRVVYVKDNTLYSDSVAGGDKNIIDSQVEDFMITPDSARVVYRKKDVLYSSAVDKGSPVLIDTGIENYSCVTSDSGRVLYTKKNMLYSSKITGGDTLLIDTDVVDFAIELKGLFWNESGGVCM